MGLALDLDGLDLPEAREELHHLAHRGMPDPGRQLAVGVGARPSLAEVHVRLGVEAPLPHQAGHVPAAGAHRLAPVDHDGAHPALEQPPRAEEPGRPGAEDHRRELRGADGRGRGLHLRGDGLHAGGERGQRSLDLRLGVYHPAWMPLAAGVERSARHGERDEVAARDAEPLGHAPLERVVRLVEPELDSGDAVAHEGRESIGRRCSALRSRLRASLPLQGEIA